MTPAAWPLLPDPQADLWLVLGVLVLLVWGAQGLRRRFHLPSGSAEVLLGLAAGALGSAWSGFPNLGAGAGPALVSRTGILALAFLLGLGTAGGPTRETAAQGVGKVVLFGLPTLLVAAALAFGLIGGAERVPMLLGLVMVFLGACLPGGATGPSGGMMGAQSGLIGAFICLYLAVFLAFGVGRAGGWVLPSPLVLMGFGLLGIGFYLTRLLAKNALSLVARVSPEALGWLSAVAVLLAGALAGKTMGIAFLASFWAGTVLEGRADVASWGEVKAGLGTTLLPATFVIIGAGIPWTILIQPEVLKLVAALGIALIGIKLVGAYLVSLLGSGGDVDMPWTTSSSGGLMAAFLACQAYGFFPGVQAAMVGGWVLHVLLLHLLSGRRSLQDF